MKDTDQVLIALSDGRTRVIAMLCSETGCTPRKIEDLARNGLVRPAKGKAICITPRGMQRLHGRIYAIE